MIGRLLCALGLHAFAYHGRRRNHRTCARPRCDLREVYRGQYFELDICDSGWRPLWVQED
jgi:hypothetical protein